MSELGSYFLTLACLAMALSVQHVSAQALDSCPGITIGTLDGGGAIYSDCSLTNPNGIPGFHATLFLDQTQNQVVAKGDGFPPEFFTPAPSGNVPYGTLDIADPDVVVEDMGPSYSGTCGDMTSPIPTLELEVLAVDGNVYCYRVSNTDGNQLWIRGRADTTDNTWSDPIVVTNQSGVGTPATPVPALPLWALWILAGITGLIGSKKLRKST